jgi:hypothetical protein
MSQAVKVSDSKWIIEIQENGKTKELFVQFPDEAMNQMGWYEGDVIEWLDNGDGSWTLKKQTN